MAIGIRLLHSYCSQLYTEPNRIEAKGYGIKNSITNLMNQFTCTLDATTVLEYMSQEKVLLFLVSKKT